MKIAIIYSPQHKKLENVAKTLGKSLEHKGHRVEYLHIARTERPLSVGKYDVVYFGSVTEGFFGAKIPVDVSEYIRQCRGFQSVKSVAFIPSKFFGTTKGLRRLMGILESAGSQVMDFEVIGGTADAEALAERLRG